MSLRASPVDAESERVISEGVLSRCMVTIRICKVSMMIISNGY